MLKRKDLFSRKFTLHYMKIQCSLYLTLQLYSISKETFKTKTYYEVSYLFVCTSSCCGIP